jgi:hypothetical protein
MVGAVGVSLFIPYSSLKKSRHSGVGRNPDDQIFPAQVGQHRGFVRFAEYFPLLDTGLHRYDDKMDNLGLFNSYTTNRPTNSDIFE